MKEVTNSRTDYTEYMNDKDTHRRVINKHKEFKKPDKQQNTLTDKEGKARIGT